MTVNFQKLLLLKFVIFLSLLICGSYLTAYGQGTRYYVDQSVEASGDGRSWQQAFKTLQEAIDVADEEETDEIWVAKGVYYPTKTSSGVLSSTSGQVTFFLGKHVRIYGGFDGGETTREGRNWVANETILSGDFRGTPEDSTDNAYHIVTIVGFEDNPIGNELILDGFTITGGYAYYQGAVTVKGFGVQNYWGGGIINVFASPTLNNLIVSKNTGFVGGGIHNHSSSPIISNTEIIGNGAPLGSAGGGIYNNYYSSPILTNVSVRNNFNSSGGGMYNHNFSAPVITDCEFLGNDATNTGTEGLGGAIFNLNGAMRLTNVVIEGNRARTRGAGVYNRSTVSDSDTRPVFNNVSIRDNSPHPDATILFGAGIYNTGRTLVLTINGGEISGNRAFNNGGGIYIEEGSLIMNGTVVNNNQTTNGYGGGIAARVGNEILLTDVIISNNRTARTSLTAEGGGFYSLNNEKVVVTGGRIERNYAQHAGGGIYYYGGSESVSDKFSGIIITENESASSGGGAVFHAPINLEISHLVVSDNIGYSSGGISVINAEGLYGKDILIEGNRTTETPSNGNGGGISFTADLLNAVIELTDIVIRENHSESSGGGIYMYASSPRIDRLTVSGNTAKVDGGGVAIEGSSNPTLTNLLLSGNKSVENGGGLYVYSSSPVITNATIAGNQGAGVYAYRARNTKIRNSIIYGNSAGLVFIDGRPDPQNSLVQSWNTNWGSNNLNSDPVFTDLPEFTGAPFTGGDYTLQESSPAIDAGSDVVFEAGQTPLIDNVLTDLAKNHRFAGNHVDMGVFEYGSSPFPVKLVSFEGGLEGPVVRLIWRTTQEINASHFEIQRSLDARVWVSVGEVSAVGESETLQSYIFLDSPGYSGSGLLYYRLRMVDRDGSEELSTIISLQNTTKGFSPPTVLAYPNPVSDYLHVDISDLQAASVVCLLLNSRGEVVLETASRRIEVMSLPEGIYILRVQSADLTSIHKILITR